MGPFAALSDTARRFVHLQRDLAFIVPGWAYYLATGRTPVRAYHCMRDLFCVTDGRFNDTVSDVMRLFRPPLALDSTTGVLGDMSGPALERVVRDLDEEGYHVFDRRLPPEVVDEMHAFALRTPCRPFGEGIEVGQSVLFDERTARAPVLHFDSEILLDCPPVRKLLLDKSILSVAQAYVRQRVVLDTPRMWWSTPGTGQASSAAAQMYHFDMDRLRWLNFFFLLTDVDRDNGPHCFARRSHKRKPAALQKDGRHSDEAISNHYTNSLVEIGGPRGTIFAEDTRGFHKGKLPRKGCRLMFQLVFANSLFGQTYERVNIALRHRAEFAEARQRFPSLFATFRDGEAQQSSAVKVVSQHAAHRSP